MIDPSRIRVPGPLEAFAAGFARELSRQGYTPNSACLQMHLMAHLSRWLGDKRLDGAARCVAEVERFLADRRAVGYTNHRTVKAMRPMLSYLRELGVAPTPPPSGPHGPVEAMLVRYRHYLMVERGLGSATARGPGGIHTIGKVPVRCRRLSPRAASLSVLLTMPIISLALRACTRRG
jgi:integrase/recombinase XerD